MVKWPKDEHIVKNHTMAGRKNGHTFLRRPRRRSSTRHCIMESCFKYKKIAVSLTWPHRQGMFGNPSKNILEFHFPISIPTRSLLKDKKYPIHEQACLPVAYIFYMETYTDPLCFGTYGGDSFNFIKPQKKKLEFLSSNLFSLQFHLTLSLVLIYIILTRHQRKMT